MTRRQRIVLVDDDPDVIDRVTQLLEDDYDIEATTDWASLSNVFFKERCDLILMDVNLPVLKGDKLVEILGNSLRHTARRERPRIVYFSSEDEDTMARLVRETKADGYLSKGLRAAELLARIKGFLET